MIYVPNGSKEEAQKLSKHLIEKKYVACSNIFPIISNFNWNFKFKNENEVVSIFKTRKENWEFLQQEITRIHSYECPCIIKIECEANEAYKKWIFKETIDCQKIR